MYLSAARGGRFPNRNDAHEIIREDARGRLSFCFIEKVAKITFSVLLSKEKCAMIIDSW